MSRVSTVLTVVVCLTVCFHVTIASNKTKVIESFHVKSDIRYRLATTQIESVVRNTAGIAQEIFFDVTLPKEAFIISFAMKIDGKVYKGEVKEKSEAKKTYLDAVERGQTAGHVKQAARHANVFEVSVNVANGSAATFTLTYQEMMRRKLNAYQQEIHISPGQAVKDFLIEVFIQENKPLRFVKSPALQTGSLLTNKIEVDSKITVIDRPSANSAYISYRPSLSDQGDGGLSARFIVEYDVEHSAKGEILVVDGYFVHFFAPDIAPMPKDIVFILDVSGSMSGQKIQQLKDAMLAILGDLQREDRFHIITFSSSVHKWESEFSSATPETIERARTFIRSIVADGGTNINSALVTGALELKGIEDPTRAGMIFFLTDGQPTEGIVDPSRITANVLETNGNTSAIFGLAFGKYADYDLLTTISNQNSGFARKIYEDADAALQVASLYKEISAVSMKHLSIDYLPSSVDEFTVTKRDFPVILTGTEVIVCGRLAEHAEVFQMEMTAIDKSGPVNMIIEIDNVTDLVIDGGETDNKFFTMPRDFSGIVERMWAYLTIKEYLKDKEIYASNETKVEELKAKIIQTAIKYKFVTPLTSMVVTKPDSREKAVESSLEDADSRQESKQQSGRVFHSFPDYVGRGAAVHSNGQFGPQFMRYNGGPQFFPSRSQHPVNSKAKKRKQGNRKVDNTFSATPPTPTSDMILTAITVRTSNLSLCLAPKKIKNGSYELIKTPTGTQINIEIFCFSKSCKDIVVKSIAFNKNGSSTKISVQRNHTWEYNNGSHTSVTQSDSRLTVQDTESEYEVAIDRAVKNGLHYYTINITLPLPKGNKGFIGDILNMKSKQLNKWRKTKVPAICKDKSTDISRTVNNKMLAGYKFMP
ncbi:unnamed protein product [Candidula unifasciata]|uniref:Inter-alpha-trypsin inhibitor heavy chain H4 n=1 Tax=Candidula unifasciata TaxID=100452 RepID=A0A8S3YRA7_9EUPU|nr:unnamed protein product [Candidula unifasciata]